MTVTSGQGHVRQLLRGLDASRPVREAFLADLGLSTSNRDPFAEFSERFASFGDKLPAQLWTELDILKHRLRVR